MGKASLLTPLYISFAWILMLCYHLFTQTAIATAITQIVMFWPSIAAWIVSRMNIIVLIYDFAWIFLLSSVIPSFILGRERSVLIQFFVCLTLTLLVFIVQRSLPTYGGETVKQMLSLTVFFHNPLLAAGYLLAPYIFMLILDIRSSRRSFLT